MGDVEDHKYPENINSGVTCRSNKNKLNAGRIEHKDKGVESVDRLRLATEILHQARMDALREVSDSFTYLSRELIKEARRRYQV